METPSCTYPLYGTPDIPWAIMFEKNSDVLDANGEKGIDEVVKTKHLQGARPTIVRFTAIGYAEADEQNPSDLSERRAKRVIDALAKHGIAAERMEAHGLGTARASNAVRTTVPNRFVAFTTLYESRGPAKYWANDHLEKCEPGKDPPLAPCAPPSFYVPYCPDGRPAW